MIWMELTRTDAVFSRIAMVLFMCRNKSSRNDLKLHGTYFWKILKIVEEESMSGGPPPVHEGGGAPAPWAHPPTSWAPYCSTDLDSNSIYSCSGRKNKREGFITIYDTDLPPSPKLSWEGWSGVRSGLRRGESVAVVIINHPPSQISWCLLPCMSNSIVGLLDGDGLDEIYHVIELVLLGFDP